MYGTCFSAACSTYIQEAILIYIYPQAHLTYLRETEQEEQASGSSSSYYFSFYLCVLLRKEFITCFHVRCCARACGGTLPRVRVRAYRQCTSLLCVPVMALFSCVDCSADCSSLILSCCCLFCCWLFRVVGNVGAIVSCTFFVRSVRCLVFMFALFLLHSRVFGRVMLLVYVRMCVCAASPVHHPSSLLVLFFVAVGGFVSVFFSPPLFPHSSFADGSSCARFCCV